MIEGAVWPSVGVSPTTMSYLMPSSPPFDHSHPAQQQPPHPPLARLHMPDHALSPHTPATNHLPSPLSAQPLPKIGQIRCCKFSIQPTIFMRSLLRFRCFLRFLLRFSRLGPPFSRTRVHISRSSPCIPSRTAGRWTYWKAITLFCSSRRTSLREAGLG